MTIKSHYHCFKTHGVYTIFLITSGKQMSKNYVLFFYHGDVNIIQWALHVQWRRYVEDQISANFYVISTYFFDVILLVKKSTLFPRTFLNIFPKVEKSTLFSRTFFDVILMVDTSTLFPRNFFDLISMAKTCTLFPRTFFSIISMVETSTLFPHTFYNVISLVEIFTDFLLTFFDVILMVEKSTFHVIFSTKVLWVKTVRHFC